MSEFVAALPMYDWPRAETDAEWGRLRDAFEEQGIDAPEHLARRNADLPPVPGGIRGADGTVLVPDPARLPPDELDFHAVWLHPRLLFTQTCWGPMELGLSKHVQVIGQPSYDAFEGGRGEFYSSAIVMRRTSPSPLWGGSIREADRGAGDDISVSSQGNPQSTARVFPPPPDPSGYPPHAGAASIPLDLIRSKRLAYNSLDSMSGIIALTRDLDALGENLDIFSERIETGAHRASIIAVAEGRADVAAIDCRSWGIAQRFEPKALEVSVVGWTGHRKGLPYITGANTPAHVAARLRAALGGKDQPAKSLLSSR
jgi:ABC-type phosphate/phosphonate transport system substrate-binding protein